MNNLEQRLKKTFGDCFKILQLDHNLSTILVDINKLANGYKLDCKPDFNESRLVWERFISRRGHTFQMHYYIDGTVQGTQETIDFSIDRMNQDFKKELMKQG